MFLAWNMTTVKVYKLTFQLTKNKSEGGFDYFVKLAEKDNLSEFIEGYCNVFKERYDTPIKCIKTEEIPDYPKELQVREELKDGD